MARKKKYDWSNPHKLTYDEFLQLHTNARPRWFFEAAQMYYNGKEYVLEGRTGEERLDAEHTTYERLLAHWLGFAENNRYTTLRARGIIP